MPTACSSLWIGDQPLVLASSSKARKAMLTSAGIEIDVIPAEVDERSVQMDQGSSLEPHGLASLLSEAKALSVSQRLRDRLVLGADQTLELDGVCFVKAPDRVSAHRHLERFSGCKHRLHSAFCFARDGRVLNAGVASAELTMRILTDEFISAYLDAAGPEALASVGVYQLEGIGIQLFESIEGDWFTILGLPLQKVISFLRADGQLRS
jgi:nucleoside triphosphate pyrophosphatase